jgi:chromosome segregation ATPase
MTKTSKCLTIAAIVFSIVFMGIAAVMSTTHTDWKERATKEFPQSQITAQRTQIQDLTTEIESLDKQQKVAETSNAADSVAITVAETGRVAQLERELAALIEEGHKIAEQVEAEARQVDAKQAYAKRLRGDVTRLQSQYEDLVAQKEDALANVKRLRDLLFQAKGVLERVKKRQEALEAEGTDYGSETASPRQTLRPPASTLK